MKKKTLLLALLALTSVGVLASCTATKTETVVETVTEYKKPAVVDTYIAKYTITQTSTYKDDKGVEQTSTSESQYYEQLQLFEDNTYALTQVNPSSMTNYIYYIEGTYTMGKADAKYDGYTEIVLSDATHVQANFDIYNGMFSLCIDSETSTFPHELAGGSMLNTKEDFLAQYGKPGNRYIYEVAVQSDTKVENRMCIEADVKVVE